VTEALAAVGDADEVLRARLLAELLNGTDEAARPDEAAEVRALAELHELGDVEARLAIWDAQRHYAERRWDDYRGLLYEAARKFRAVGDERGLAVRTLADSIPILIGTFDESSILDNRVIAPAERLGNHGFAALMRGRQAIVEIQRDNRERARELLDAGALSRREHVMLAVPNAWLAELEGDLPRAKQILEEMPADVAYPRSWLSAARARLALLMGDEAGAREHFSHWEREFEEIRHQTPGLVCMGLLEDAVTLPDREHREEMLEQCATWDGLHYGNYGTFDRVRGVLALSLDRVEEAESHFHVGFEWAMQERCWAEAGRCELKLAGLAKLRRDGDEALRLASSGLERLRQGGGVLEIAQAEEQVAALRETRAAGGHPDDLSEREIEVLQHMAAGESNPEISAALFIAPATVASHVRSILAKTGTANRVQASSWALRHRLLAEDSEN